MDQEVTAVTDQVSGTAQWLASVSTFDLLTLAAILLGPILAILASRYLENRKEKRARKMDIFRTMMRTRRSAMLPEHVGALNLVEIEFADDAKVMADFRKLLGHYGGVHNKGANEDPRDFDRRIFEERQKLLAKLLHSIAEHMDFKVEQLEIFEGGYTPQGWHDVEEEQRLVRRFIIELGKGTKVLPAVVLNDVQVNQPQDNSDSGEDSGSSESGST